MRLIAAGLRIVFFGLIAVAYFATKYPWEAAGIVAGLIVLAYFPVQHKRERVYALDVRSMSPVEFEQHCAEVLRRAGWSTSHIGRQGDQGVDVIAELRGIKAVVQCKLWRGRVGNSAVQEVVAGKKHYGAQLAVVVAPFGYTRAAEQLAHSNAAFLMSHRDLANLEHVARVP